MTLTETLIKLTGYGELQGTQIAAFWIGVVAVIEKLLINPLARHIFDEQVGSGEGRVVTAILDDHAPADIEWRKI